MTNRFETIKIEKSGKKTTIWLARPQIHNAFNEKMIAEISTAFQLAGSDSETRVIILRGEGKSFCAGADLNWMRDVASYSYEQNLNESLNLSECFHTIYHSPKPTIAVVHGAAIGGANGLIAACDLALCDHDTIFSLSEVKIGIIPACISPYVVKRVGEFKSRELMLTGRRINGFEAEKAGLVNRTLPFQEIEPYLNDLLNQLYTSGPEAVRQCKNLLLQVCNQWSLDEAYHKTAQMIAEIRSSDEGQEGMAAFLEKREPSWTTPD
jgi:methylglutaconyl-CoA hydratase